MVVKIKNNLNKKNEWKRMNIINYFFILRKVRFSFEKKILLWNRIVFKRG